ncbi:hypothetical protein [Klebsiella quasipneumoniae]|uniref:hypothetical protein n=1 Tax=Klebsiella quasipneumoniae TaxID=1463165 RepID=UPI00161280D7|nr:hypothetical protein [Klebsiella quasipneumoniae]QNC78714.1 hypothetical protein F3137_09045 [Klebsiella quasipneumoniae]
MGKMTFVVEFEDGKEPPVHADMNIFGGKITRVAFSDVIQDMEDMELDNRASQERYEFYQEIE